TKADVVAFVKKAFGDGASAIKAKGDKGMSELVVDPFVNQQVRISDFAYSFIEHSGEHYGQLVVYYRLSGLVPPESRPKK
ncbi:MAG: DinB family protein, partial [Candidatus Sulfotelmatobacter sp.]